MLLTLTGLSGIAPRFNASVLAPTQAQTANNVLLYDGALGPLIGGAQVATIVGRAGTKKTLYRFGHDAPSDTNYWFSWLNEVSVCRSPIFGDTTERTYFTGDGKPQFTDASLALSSTPYPFAAYDLGVPSPSTAMIATVTGTGTGVAETRAYVSTFVRNYNGWAEESMPSPVVMCDVLPGQGVDLSSLPTAPAGNHHITHHRIYRTATGAQGTNYYFVTELPIATASYSDAIAGSALGEVLPSLTWDMPPDGLKGIVYMGNGVLAGFMGKDVYFCDPWHPHAWPADYILTVDYPIVGLAAFGSSLLVLTTGTPFLISGTHPAALSQQHLDIEQACVSRRSIARFGNGVIYAGPDGLVYVGTDGSNIATTQLMLRKEWQALCVPSTIHGYEFDGRYYGFHSTGGFIFDPAEGAKALTTHSIVADAAYVDLQSDSLYYLAGDVVSKLFTGTALTYTWKSKKFVLPRPMNFSCAQVIADDYSSATLKLYVNGVLKHTQAVSSAAIFRLPSGFRGNTVEVELTGTSRVIAAYLAESVAEIAGV